MPDVEKDDTHWTVPFLANTNQSVQEAPSSHMPTTEQLAFCRLVLGPNVLASLNSMLREARLEHLLADTEEDEVRLTPPFWLAHSVDLENKLRETLVEQIAASQVPRQPQALKDRLKAIEDEAEDLRKRCSRLQSSLQHDQE